MSDEYPVANCVGAGRIEGWFWHGKDSVDEQGYGHIQSFCFEGDLLFETKKSPGLRGGSVPEYKRGDPCTFEVIEEGTGNHRAVAVAIPGAPAPTKDEPLFASTSGTQPEELVGRRVEGTIATSFEDVSRQRWGHLCSNDFAGNVVFQLDENPALETIEYGMGDVVSFELFGDNVWGGVRAWDMQMVMRSQNDEDDGPKEKKRRKKAAGPYLENPWDSAPRLLPVSLAAGESTPEEKLDIVHATFEDIIANAATQYPNQDVKSLIKALISEANEMFGTDGDSKCNLGRRLNRHPWFLEVNLDVKYEAKKCRISVGKRNAWLEKARNWDKIAPLCWYWVNNKCDKGDECVFRHVLNQQEAVMGIPKDDKSTELCWYWTQGTCNKSKECLFRHHYSIEEQAEFLKAAEASVAIAEKPPETKVVKPPAMKPPAMRPPPSAGAGYSQAVAAYRASAGGAAGGRAGYAGGKGGAPSTYGMSQQW